MKFIKPLTITPALLTTTNVTETDTTEWLIGTAFTAGQTCMVTTTANGASVASHKIYTAVINNTGNDPTLDTAGTNWTETSSTNRYKMFDQIVQDQTSRSGGIDVVITPCTYTNALALINAEGSDVDIVMTSTADGEVYNENYSLTSFSGIQDWYAYFFTPIERMTELFITGLPVYLDATVAVSINSSGVAKCGALVLGTSFEIGQSLNGAQFGIIDYSVKATDAQGRITITERAYAKKAQVDVLVDTVRMYHIGMALAEVLNTPVVFAANEDDSNTVIYGYYREFQTVYSDYRSSMCSLQIEGLT